MIFLENSCPLPCSCAHCADQILSHYLCNFYLVLLIFIPAWNHAFCNLYSYLSCCMTCSEKFAFFTRIVIVTSSIYTDTAHRRITFHVCIVTEKYVSFYSTSPAIFLIFF